VDLVENPARAGAWTYDDPVLLRAQGAASGVVARLLAEGGLGSPEARILDVGTGVAGLAIAFCSQFPEASVVGVDPWAPALAIARENVAGAGLESRITLLQTGIESLEDADGFDLAWLPTFFVPEQVLDTAIRRIFGLLRPGGTLVAAVQYEADDPLAAAVDDLFTVRSGGSVIGPDEAVTRLRGAGFSEVRELERTWDVPLRFVVGSRAG
jgi:SAM-dependent methyltransferase